MSDPIARLWRRVLLTIGRGRISSVLDSGQVQRVQVKAGADETIDGVPRLAEYGFQSNPPVDSDGILLFLAGDRSNGVVIACGSQKYRMRGLQTGEVAISDDKGQSVYLSAAGIVVNGGGLPINITNSPFIEFDAPQAAFTGSVLIAGDLRSNSNIVANGDISDQSGAKSMATMRSEYNSHTHGASPTPTPTM